jgi:predicted transposase/invertase (TIGR01784 family)
MVCVAWFEWFEEEIYREVEEVEKVTVEERGRGIYTVTGDIIPIQIIDSRELSDGENLWLRNLDNGLNVEAIRMSDMTLEQVLERTGLTAKWEARGEARGKAEGEAREAMAEERVKREVAKNLINIGLPLEQVAQATGLDIETLTQYRE